VVTGKARNIPINALSPIVPVSPVMSSARAVDLEVRGSDALASGKARFGRIVGGSERAQA
jgi:hypothetical protein